jgi:hypothetical protein
MFIVIGTSGCNCASGPATASKGHSPSNAEVFSAQAIKLFPLEAKTGKFRITQGPATGQERDYKLEPDGAAGASDQNNWKLILTGVRILYLQQNKDGSISIRGEDEFEDNVAVRYDPPLLALPATMVSGKTYTSQSKMVVTVLDTGAAREKGSCKLDVTLLRREKVNIEGQVIETYQVQGKRTIKLQWASVDVVGVTDYGIDRGPVRDKIDQVTRILGFPKRKTEGMIMLN